MPQPSKLVTVRSSRTRETTIRFSVVVCSPCGKEMKMKLELKHLVPNKFATHIIESYEFFGDNVSLKLPEMEQWETQLWTINFRYYYHGVLQEFSIPKSYFTLVGGETQENK